MANDLATLTTKLSTQLRDTTHAVWAEAEKNDLLTWAIAGLDLERPRYVRESVTLADDDDQYSLTACLSVHRVDLLDENSQLIMPLPGGTWELWGDGQSLGTLYINPSYARTGWFLRVHGYAAFDLTVAANYPPDRMVPLVLAVARGEALRRQINERANFKDWTTINQTSNTSVNELVQMVNEADSEASRLRRELRIIHKPKPARV